MGVLLISSTQLSGTVTVAAGSLRATHSLSTKQGQTSVFEGSWGWRELDHLSVFGLALFRALCLMSEGSSHERRLC